MTRRHNRVNDADPYKLYLAIEFGSALCMAVYGTLAAVYRVRTAGLNPLELVLIGTALEASAFVFEVPTGLLADVFSRRLSIILGIVLVGAGFALEGAVPLFPVMLLAQVIWGLGYTFTSGAQEAWIADEVGEARAARAYVGGAQAGQIGALLGIPVAVALASLRLNLPLIAGGAGMVALGVALIPLMPERGFHPTPRAERSSWRQMGDTLRSGGRLVRRSPVLLTILGIGLFYGLYSEAVDRLWEAHFLKDIGFPALGGVTPVIWLGAIDATAVLLSLAATEAVRRRVDTASHIGVARALFIMTGLIVLCLVAFGLAATFALGVVAYLGFSLLRKTSRPFYTAWLVQHTESSVRATVISASGLADAFGQIAGGPLLGVVGLFGSIRAALVAAGGILSPALLLYARTLRRDAPAVVAPEGGLPGVTERPPAGVER